MKTIKEFKNDLLKRKELLVSFEADKNPGFESSKQMIVEKMKVDADKIAVKSVRSHFGSREFTVEAFVYDSAKDREIIEPKVKPKKAKGGA